jgi:hypothetical protein
MSEKRPKTEKLKRLRNENGKILDMVRESVIKGRVMLRKRKKRVDGHTEKEQERYRK